MAVDGTAITGPANAGSVPLTELPTQSNNTILGNVSGSAATPLALTATQVTALLNPATSSLQGAMTAAQVTQLAGFVSIRNSAIASGTTASASWSAGAYRRISVITKMITGNSNPIQITFTGLSAGTYNTDAAVLTAGLWVDRSTAAQNFFSIDYTAMSPTSGMLKFDAQIATDGAGRCILGSTSGNTGAMEVFSGVSTDTTHDVTGVVLTFSTACTGWMEVNGYV